MTSTNEGAGSYELTIHASRRGPHSWDYNRLVAAWPEGVVGRPTVSLSSLTTHNPDRDTSRTTAVIHIEGVDRCRLVAVGRRVHDRTDVCDRLRRVDLESGAPVEQWLHSDPVSTAKGACSHLREQRLPQVAKFLARDVRKDLARGVEQAVLRDMDKNARHRVLAAVARVHGIEPEPMTGSALTAAYRLARRLGWRPNDSLQQFEVYGDIAIDHGWEFQLYAISDLIAQSK